MKPNAKDKQTDELLELLGSPIAYRSEFTRLPGVTVPGALFLSQALFWTKSPTAQARDGWFYKSQSGETDSWEAETGMTVKQQVLALNSYSEAAQRLQQLYLLPHGQLAQQFLPGCEQGHAPATSVLLSVHRLLLD